MAAFADLGTLACGVEAGVRSEERDVTAVMTTVVEIQADIRWLKGVVTALAAHQGLAIPDVDEDFLV